MPGNGENLETLADSQSLRSFGARFSDFASFSSLSSDALAKRFSNAPLVVQEEDYCIRGVGRKLKVSYSTISRWLERGIINESGRNRENEDGIKLDNLSLAQLVSFIFRKPLERIYVPESYFRSERFLSLPPKSQINSLVNAYTGCVTFDHITNRLRSIEQSILHIKIKEWEIITLGSLTDKIVLSKYAVKFLKDKGFIRDENLNPIICNNRHNPIDNNLFAYLLSRILHRDLQDLFAKKKDDLFYNALSTKYIPEILSKYLIDAGLKPFEYYSAAEAGRILDRDSSNINKLCRRFKSGTIRTKRGQRFRGLDLAVSAMQNDTHSKLKAEDIANLFGVSEREVGKLRINIGQDGFYSNHIAFELHNSIIRDSIYPIGKIYEEKKLDRAVERVKATLKFVPEV